MFDDVFTRTPRPGFVSEPGCMRPERRRRPSPLWAGLGVVPPPAFASAGSLGRSHAASCVHRWQCHGPSGHVWCHVVLPQLIHKPRHVVALVSGQRDPAPARDLTQKLECRFPLCPSRRMRQPSIEGQPVSMLHDHVAHEGELGLTVLGRQPRIRIRCGLVRVVASLFPVEIHRRIAAIIWSGLGPGHARRLRVAAHEAIGPLAQREAHLGRAAGMDLVSLTVPP